MKKLDHLIASAREADPEWTSDRSARVLSSAIDRRERRVARGRLARRALGVGSAAAVIGLLFLRGANASPTTTNDVQAQPATTIAAAETLGDAGYARD